MTQDTEGCRAPAWIGIGAQRAGTTWLTRLLLRHPAVCLAPSRRGFLAAKERETFEGVLHSASAEGRVDAYRQLFAGAENSHPGEFSPSYLRSPWIAGLIREVVGPHTILICIVRDPVERFLSATRWYRNLGVLDQNPRRFSRLVGGDAMWGGMYATQLRMWRTLFDRDRFVVVQYEAALRDPAGTAGTVWKAMGLEPVELGSPEPSTESTSTRDAWSDDLENLPDLRSNLRSIYRAEVDELEADWGIDPTLWTTTVTR